MNSQAMCVRLMILVTIILAATTKSSTAITQPKPNCQTTCGNLTNITFPFGTSPDCYLDDTFFINCSPTQPPQPFFRHGNLPVLNISQEDGEISILHLVSGVCFNSSGFINSSFLKETSVKFPLSYTRNKFIGVGCATAALISGPNYTTGCISDCVSVENVVNGSCSGIGCCESQIPKGAKKIEMDFRHLRDHSSVQSFNPCSYMFVAEEGSYSFESSDLRDLRGRDRFPVVLDWAVDSVTCNEAKQNKLNYACRSSDSECIEATNGPGYRCKCLSGFEGNPYLNNGCQDIDECEKENDCEKKCVNIHGNYTCSCPKGYHGDGRKSGKGCTADQFLVIKVVLGTAISVTVLLVCFYLIYFGLRKRKLIMLKEKFFQQNGGFLLQQQLSRRERSNETATIFSAEELERATDNYANSRIIGKGGYGTVYKGILADNRTVAIKKSKVVDQTQIEQFINEVVVLSQINHRNVVKLLGCCLETQVPLLVYEFIANGTLFDHIHDESKASSMTFEVRLRIAAETAGVLSYLHSSASTPIIHRDVKPTNILLDDNYVAKVSDFGASRLVPLDQDELSTIVQGTFGYLDPEYMHTSQLTEKSDVYSFGVVLVELLTGKKVLCFNRPEGDRNLAVYFLSALKDNRLFDVVEDNIKHDQGNTDQLMEVAKLAKRCLRVKGDERPTMKEVAMELEGLRVVEKHPWVNSANLISEETEYLLLESSFKNHDDGGGSSNVTTSYDSITKQVAFSIDGGR